MDAGSRRPARLSAAMVAQAISVRQNSTREKPAARRAARRPGVSPHAGTAQLAGRHAVVTGASRGIGAVIAAVLAGEGVCVSLLGRDAGNLERVSDDFGGKGRAFPIVADLTDPPSVQSAFAAARGWWPPTRSAGSSSRERWLTP